jgi:16S rRNA (cytosine1402-N4)-methyltransferase
LNGEQGRGLPQGHARASEALPARSEAMALEAGDATPDHVPVMQAEVASLLSSLGKRSGVRVVDLTLGLGGHARALLEALPPDTQLLGLDRDPRALPRAAARLAGYGDRVHCVHARFSQLAAALDEMGWEEVDVVLADLGVSSLQLDDATRGFSFQRAGELDMRMDPSGGETALSLLARLDARECAALLRDFGEEPQARRIARAICAGPAEERPTTTDQLRARIASVVGPGGHGARRDPATLTFQALRIAVNQELDELDALLEALPARLAPGARVAFLAYHSLEDRRVKQAIRSWTARCVCPPALPVCRCGGKALAVRLTSGAVRPSEDEVARNPRARSARLRAVEWARGG